MKIRLSKADHKELKRKPIKHGVLLSIQNLNQLSDKIGVSLKKEYMEASMQTLFKSNNISLMTKMLDNRHFPFTYNGDEIKTGEEDFSEPRQTVYNFSCNKIVRPKAQIYSQNFKIFSQSHSVCNYYFCFQGVYEFSSTPISTLSKQLIKIYLSFCPLCIKKLKII